MVSSKSLRMNASAPPALRATPREFKGRVKSSPNLEDPQPQKYIHVHHFKTTKLYGAWFNDPSKPGKKVRLFFGSHLTAYLAARAQDRAALKYKPYALDPRSIQLNFKEDDYVADQKLREMLTCEEFGELLRKESRPKYTKMEPTPCLREFLARERARGNIPSAAPPKQEDIISLRQYLKEVIRKREQRDEDMEDTVATDEESSEDQESSDEEMEDPVPTAERKKHALTVERQKRSEGKRIITGSETPRSRPSERKPSVAAPAPLVWGRTRPRTKRQEYEHNKLHYKLNKINSTKKSREPGPPTKSEDLPTEEENAKSPVPGNEGLPQSPESQFRSPWHYKMHKLQKLQTPRTSAEILPGPSEVENTKIPEPAGSEGLLPQGSESPKVQLRSMWHYKLHKMQTLQTTSRTSQPSPKIVKGSYLHALALTVLSQSPELDSAIKPAADRAEN